MLGDGHPNSGTKGSWFKFQWGVLKLLESIAAGGVGDASAANQVIEIAAINNLGKVEDTPHVSGHTGVMALAVRNDAGLPLAADGDYIPISTDATGAVRTTAVGGSGGIAQVDKSPFIEGVTSFNPIGGVFNDVPGADPAEDNAAAARITAKRALHVNLRDAAGVEQGTPAAPINVEDTSLGAAITGVAGTQSSLVGGTYNAVLPVLASGEQRSLQLDPTGRLLVMPSTALLVEDHNYGAVGALTLRTASQIGNATGAADFNAGITTAQTLRVVLPTDQTGIPIFTSSLNPGTAGGNLGKASDDIYTPGHVGVMALAVSNQANVDLVDADGDYTPIATSMKGVVQVSGDVGDDIPQVNLNPVYSGGVAVDITALPVLTAANAAGLRINKDTGALIVLQGNLSSTQDSVTTIAGESTKQTYSAAITGLVAAAAATDIFELTGSGTKTIRIKRIEFSGTATAAGAIDVLLIKRSTADSAGTSTPTTVPHDSTNAAGTAVVKAFTANPTLGTTVGAIRSLKPTLTTAAGAIPNIINNLIFGDTGGYQPIILRGAAQTLAINLNGATIAGNSFNIDITWTEE